MLAQEYDLKWNTVGAGVGSSSNGQFVVVGTVGQADTGHLVGGSYTVDSGFWSFIAPVQTPGAPLLTIRITATNTVVVSWSSQAKGFMLQSTTSTITGNWSSVAFTANDDGTTVTAIVPRTSGYQFFRLLKP